MACILIRLAILAGMAVCACSLGWAAPETDSPSTGASAQPDPYLRLRDAALTYHGPEGEQGEPEGLAEVKIAWFGPADTTNCLAANLWRAANLAIEEANRQGGYRGMPFRLLPRWSVNPWGAGISQLARLIYEETPVAVMGSVDSASTHLAEQVVAKAQLPLISPIATDKSLTLAGVSWMFACAPTDDVIARAVVDEALNEYDSASHAFIVINATDHESRMTAREVFLELSRRNRPPGFRFETPPGAAPPATLLEAIARFQPELAIVVADAEDSARLVMELRKQAPRAVIYGMQAMARARFLELAGPAAEGVRFPLLFEPQAPSAATTAFLQQYHRRWAETPDYAAALAYDATRLLIEAIRRAGLNRVRVRDALSRLSPWPGIAGSIQFDGTGRNTRSRIQLGRISGGNIVARVNASTNPHPTNRIQSYE